MSVSVKSMTVFVSVLSCFFPLDKIYPLVEFMPWAANTRRYGDAGLSCFFFQDHVRKLQQYEKRAQEETEKLEPQYRILLV